MNMVSDPVLVGVAVTVCSWVTLNLLRSDVALDKTATGTNILVTFF